VHELVGTVHVLEVQPAVPHLEGVEGEVSLIGEPVPAATEHEGLVDDPAAPAAYEEPELLVDLGELEDGSTEAAAPDRPVHEGLLLGLNRPRQQRQDPDDDDSLHGPLLPVLLGPYDCVSPMALCTIRAVSAVPRRIPARAAV
jgi:hypothetical protein